jgi:hypothetical protein
LQDLYSSYRSHELLDWSQFYFLSCCRWAVFSKAHTSDKLLSLLHYDHCSATSAKYAYNASRHAPVKAAKSLRPVDKSRPCIHCVSYTLGLCLSHVLEHLEGPNEYPSRRRCKTCDHELTKRCLKQISIFASQSQLTEESALHECSSWVRFPKAQV